MSFPWWLEVNILPVNQDEPVTLMLENMVRLTFGVPENLEADGPRTFDIVDPETGLANPVPNEGRWLIPFELPATELIDPETGATMRLFGNGEVVVARRGDELVTADTAAANSFFDVFFDITVADENGEMMPLQPANPDEPLRIPLIFPMDGIDPIPPTDVRWMPAIFWAEGLGRELLDDAGALWDKLISIHAIPHVEIDKPIRIIVEPGLVFGNHRDIDPPPEIHGIKWHDIDGDGVRDPNEPGLPGWTIHLDGTDSSGNPVHRQVITMADDPATTIDEAGMYWIQDLSAGSYAVREELQPGWGQSFPDSGAYMVDVADGQIIDGLDFGNFIYGSIHGIKFADRDGDGQLDDNEPGIGGVEIYVIRTEDGSRVTMRTNDRGHFWFEGLRPGLYRVGEIVPDGFVPTTSTEYTLPLLSGEELVALPGQAMLGPDDPREEVVVGAELMFGNRRRLRCDLNGDGAVDASDAGILFSNWGGPGDGDINGDGIVDAADAQICFNEWTGDETGVAELVDQAMADEEDLAATFVP